MLKERFKNLLYERGWSLEYYSELSGISIDTLKNIYFGKTPDPKLSTIEKMANAFDMDINCMIGKCSHTPAERAILRNYRECGKHGKSIIELIARYEAGAIKNERNALITHKIPCVIPHGDIRQGIIYDCCETVEIETSIPEAYLSIQMINNDLAPIYCKNDVILLEDRFPGNGEYASFLSNGRIYIRKFIEENGQYRLKCLHNQGTDIVLKRMDELDYVGTCIDVIRS